MKIDLRIFTGLVRAGLGLPAASLIIALWLAGCSASSNPSSKSDSSSNSARGDQTAAATPSTPSSKSNSSSNDAHGDHAAEATPTPRIPAFFATGGEARPFPAVLDPKQFSDPVVAKAYRNAQENPEVFAQQPCYCYCDSTPKPGHRSLLDCFASDHGAG